MRKKIDNLKLILSFYEKDINTTINKLNLLYNNYKVNYSLKIKGEAKNVKKEEISEKDNKNKITNFFDLFNFQFFRIFFTYSTKKNMYIYSLIFIVIVSILSFVITIIIWILFFKKENLIMSWLNPSNELVRSTNDLMANFLIMIYTNQSFKEVSAHLNTHDYTFYLYEKLAGLYNASGYVNEIKDYILYNENLINYDCKEFYQNLNNSIFTKLTDRYKVLNETNKFHFTLETFCYLSHITIFNNYKAAYMQFFNYVQNLMEDFICGEYTDIFNFVNNNNIAQIEIFFFIIYAYLVEMLNDNIQHIYIYIFNEIDNNLNIMGIIFLIGFIYLLSTVFFLFIRNLEKDCQSFIQMRKIFKICNLNK